MMDTFDKCLEHVLKNEGGYANHPHDPGGRTNLGVTQRVWEEWTKRTVTEEEMRSLTVADVKPLYYKMFWTACRCMDLPNGVDLMVFDFAVNAGVARSAKTLQFVVNVAQDGVIGPKTITAVWELSPQDVINILAYRRELFYKSLSSFQFFGKGWLRRVEDCKKEALEMI